jgi:dipeptidyl aminopeptidase/acylaminoacyl peptidase
LQDVYNHDVADAVDWLMKRPEVDRNRVAMTGVSYGGIQILLAAEKGLGIRAFIPFAPGTMSWKNSLAQAQNDNDIGPSEVLGPMIRFPDIAFGLDRDAVA